jgi:hypothetical protein
VRIFISSLDKIGSYQGDCWMTHNAILMIGISSWGIIDINIIRWGEFVLFSLKTWFEVMKLFLIWVQ